MKSMLYAAILLAAATTAFVLWVRLAPSDPAVWHLPLDTATPALPGPCAGQIVLVPKGARATCLPPGDAAAVWTNLHDRALATPRTTLMAGSPTEGRMTWITRTNLMGYPDYTTAQVTQTPDGTRLDIFARQRFGGSDWGVNAARLTDWLATF